MKDHTLRCLIHLAAAILLFVTASQCTYSPYGALAMNVIEKQVERSSGVTTDIIPFEECQFQGYQRSKGFRVSRDRGFPLIDRGFQWAWRFQNPRVSGKIYIKHELGQKFHRTCIVKSSLWSVLFMGKSGPSGECTPRREDIFKYGNFCLIFRSYYTSDYLATWGSCIVF